MRRSPIADFLVPEGFAGPSGLRSLAREGSVVLEALAYRRQTNASRASLRSVPYVNRTSSRVGIDPVLLVPGFLAGDYTLVAMSRHLRDLGYRTYRSGIVANVGCLERGTTALERRLEQIAERRERKVAIVGHSLGGMMARGLAARRPDLVSGIVTMGSPMLAPGAAHQLLLAQVAMLRRLSGLGLSRLMGADCTTGACALRMWEESQLPLPEDLPFTAIYSKRDGIADWRACIDPAGQAREVRTSHVGMAIDPAVIRIVIETL
ncbi:MAG: esterase/lipase family protein, partial [Geminicoccaceae bacterium]